MTSIASDEFTRLQDIALQISHEAGAMLLRLIDEHESLTPMQDNALRKSSATDLSTFADRASEQLIVERLFEHRPNDGIIAEEGSKRSSATGINWIIDPIDGTTNFLHGFGSFAISIAATIDGEAVAGVVYDPLRQETYAAAAGLGARRNGHRLLAPLIARSLGEVLLGTGFSYQSAIRHLQAKLLTTILPNVCDIRRQGAAALDLCFVASQRLDAYYEAGLKPWDRAAGLLVAREAGYVYEDLELPGGLGETLLVTHPDLLSPLRDLLQAAMQAL